MKKCSRVFMILSLTAFMALAVFLILRQNENGTFDLYIKATYLVPLNLIPSDAVSTAEHSINNLIYQGLFRVRRGLEFQEDLVEEWERSEDGLSYKFSIKEDQRFHDGSPLKAEDVVQSLKYLVEESRNKGQFSSIASVEFIGPGKVQLSLKEKQSPIPLLASPVAKIYKKVSESAIAIGSGDFRYIKVGELKGKRAMFLERFSEKEQGPSIKSLVIVELSEEEALEWIKTGEAHDMVDIPTENIDVLSSLAIKKVSTPTAQTWIISPNMQSPKLMDKRVRACLSQVLDREAFIRKFVPHHTVASGYLPPSLSAKPVEVAAEATNCDRVDMPKLRLDIPSELAKNKAICAFLESEFGRVGAEVICTPVKFNELLERIATKRAELSLLSMSLDIPDVEYYFNTFRSDSSFNLSNLHSEAFDSLLGKRREAQTPEARGRVDEELNQLLADEYVTINISYPKHISYFNSCVEGLGLHMSGPAFTDYSSVKKKSDCSAIKRAGGL